VGRGEESQHAIPVHLFPKHVLDLHLNGEVGFAKEYEEIRAASCLGNDISEPGGYKEMSSIFADQ
jgi:hypothetical protein